MSELIVYTEEEIKSFIEEIYTQFPMLRDRKPTSECGHTSCETDDVRDEYGWEAANAYHRLDMWKWLLG